MSLTADDIAQIQAMIDAAAGVGEGFPQPIVAGQQLLIPGIQSPNFSLAAKTGWQILKSGVATFFNVVLSGGTLTGPDYIINPSGAFFYNGVPANGNLIVSIAPVAGADAFGNAYPQGINVTTGTIAGTTISGSVVTGTAISGSTFTGTDFLLNASGAFFYSGAPALGNLMLALAQAAGADAQGNAFPQGLLANQVTLPNQAGTPPAVTAASVFFSSTAGRPRYLSSAGANNVLQRADVNVAAFSMTTQTIATIIGAPLNYLANEGNQGSEYEIEIDGVLVAPTSGATLTLTFQLMIDGATPGGAFTIGAVFLPLGSAFTYSIRFRLTITTSGAGGAANMASDGQVSRSGVNAGSTTAPVPTIAVGAVGTGKPFDSTVNHTIQAYAFWAAGVSAGHSVTTSRSRVTRRF